MIDPALLVSRPSSVGGVILAGGEARRLGGGDKGRTEIAGRSILARQIESLTPQLATLALNAKGASERFADTGLPVLPDPPGAAGPLAGVLAALDWAEAMGFSRVLTVPCDVPFLPRDLVMRLGGSGPAIAASAGRAHPVIGLWPVELGPALRRFVIEAGERRAQAWAEYCGAVAVEWPDDPFLNVNDPAEQAAAERQAESAPRKPAALVLPPGGTAQDLVEDFAAELRQNGVRVGGLIQRGRKSEAVLVALDDGTQLPIMQKLGQGSSCAVDGGAVAEASAVVRRAIRRGDDLIVINKFGPLEADRSGLAAEMMEAMAEGLPLLTTVTLDRIESWLAFTGGWCELLPAERAALWRWWAPPHSK